MKVLIYDGECNMCSRFIRFIVDMNTNSELKITDFNSNWTKANYETNTNIDSMIFIDNSKEYIYSDAVIKLMASTHFIFKPLLIALIIPRTIRDGIYKFIAKRRRQIMTNKACPVINQKAKKMFLF
ncbi:MULTISPECIES: thiol-disulfide oxidoreductase DCC family protein [Cytobacillus]|uniref:DUF393 domain-containing protein n=1 Tax=Cytobacillus stercorigallinarum TaxID=2762240 RepID=A0ABR8QTS6_9BACI|nr:DUF393 domain-containing protein [Cytobacillus stercorigallinarum]MBD7938934.1 DUF393 domain-containing protein [Cytobacillus stercorigallinarum]